MPIYEYRCECGATVEAVEKVGAARAVCGELCVKTPPTGTGRVERIFSPPGLRGTGHEAAAPTVDLRKRSGRHWDDCD